MIKIVYVYRSTDMQREKPEAVIALNGIPDIVDRLEELVRKEVTKMYEVA